MLKIIKTSLTEKNFEKYEKLSMQTKYGVNLHPSWLRAYIDHFGYKGKELFLELRDSNSNDLKGLLPMVVQEQKDTRFIKLKRLIPCGYRPTDFFPLIIKPGFEEDFSKLIVEWLTLNPDQWDKIFINYIPKHSSPWSSLVEEFQKNGFKINVKSDREFLTIDTSGDYNNYLEYLGTKKLAKIRYKKNKIIRRVGQVKYYNIYTNVSEYYNEFISVYMNRRKTAEQSDPFTRVAPTKEFFREIVESYSKKNFVRLSILTINDNRVAYLLNLVYNGVVYYLMPAFKPEYEKWSPGLVFLNELIKDAFEDETIKEFNFMRSVYDYKLWWQPRRETYIEISVDNKYSLNNRINTFFVSLSKMKDILLHGK